jgi:hypothetical protein
VLVKGLSASAGGGGDRKHGFRGGGCHGRQRRARLKRGCACARRSAAALNRGATSCFRARRWTAPWYGGLGTARMGRQRADQWASASAAGGERVAQGIGFRGDLGGVCSLRKARGCLGMVRWRDQTPRWWRPEAQCARRARRSDRRDVVARRRV